METKQRRAQLGGARHVVLGATQRVHARKGAWDFSLDGVAVEAGMATNELGHQFHSPNEMLVTLAADGITNLPPTRRETPLSPAHVEGTVAGATVPNSSLAILESHLRSLEHSIGDLSAFAHATTAEIPKNESDEQRVHQIGERLDVIEKKHEESIAKLRSLILETAIRAAKRTNAPPAQAELSLRLVENAHEEAQASVFPPSPQDQPTPDMSASADSTESAFDAAITEHVDKTSGHDLAERYLMAARLTATQDAVKGKDENEPTRLSERPKTSSAAPFMILGSVIAIVCSIVVIARIVLGGVPTEFAADTGSSVAVKKTFQKTPLPQSTMVLASPATADDRQAEALKLVLAQASRGNTDAALLAGLDYLEGHGVAKNDAEAYRWLQVAAENGQAVAQFELGQLYEHGHGIAGDKTMAAHWYEAAATQGNVKAMNSLARVYATGEGVGQNMTEAAHWFASAAVLGYTTSQFNLAVLYERGSGVPKSLLEAEMWYLIAAASGDVESKAHAALLGMQLTAEETTAAQEAADAFQPAPTKGAANIAPEASVLASR